MCPIARLRRRKVSRDGNGPESAPAVAGHDCRAEGDSLRAGAYRVRCVLDVGPDRVGPVCRQDGAADPESRVGT